MNRIGFIGYGNMAQAIATGLVKANPDIKDDLYACAKHYDKLCANVHKLGIHPLKDALEVVKTCDWIIIAVKPYIIKDVLSPLVDDLKDKVVISVAAGCGFGDYEQLLLPGTHHLSTIPNTPVAVCQGIFICEEQHSLSNQEVETFKSLFSSIALVEFVPSHLLSIGGTISGCTPAFTAMYLEALGDAGVKHGLSRDVAYRLVAKMLVGTGQLYLNNPTHPGIMKDQVCSPGGATIKGVAALEKAGFRSTLIEAIDHIEGE